jgi:beta-galactosidase
MLYTADNWRHIPEGSLPSLFAATNFGINNHQRGMDNLAAARPGQALFVSEYWPGWFDHWGHPHETRPVAPQIADIDYILNRGSGINIYMFHGGTSFGFGAGSSYINDKFLPDVTSYDYDAPLDESGRPTPKYFAYRKELAKFSPCGNESCLPPVPTVASTIAVPKIQLSEATPLWDNLPKPIASAQPAPMEIFGQDFGYILYRTMLPTAVHGNLVMKDVHDFATVSIGGKFVGALDRRKAAPDGSLPPIDVSTVGPAQLDILVANDGRVNVDHTMRTETKGITQSVVLDGHTLSGWQVYSLPMSSEPHPAEGKVGFETSKPVFLYGSFELTAVGDTFLDIHNLGKGVIWINGHNLGRFWSVGPQQTLYVPGPWLRKGSNEIVVFDMLPTTEGYKDGVAGLDHPILDGPVSDKTTSNQE